MDRQKLDEFAKRVEAARPSSRSDEAILCQGIDFVFSKG
jgi:hypothetical protein